MRTKNLVILSDSNLFYGNEPGIIRMNNYAKSVSKNENINVYLISTINFRKEEELINQIAGIFTSIKKQNVPKHTGFSTIKHNFIFALSVYQWKKKLKEDTVFLVYPSVDFSFEFFVLFFVRFISRSKVYYELNEVRKNANVLKTDSFLSIPRWILNNIKYSVSQFLWFYYDGLICISNLIETFSKRYNKNTIVIPILSDYDRQELKFTNASDNFKILFTGSVSIRKENLVEFLLALVEINKINQNWSFVMCGPIFPGDERIIRKLLEINNIESKVQILGVLPHEVVIKMQKEASLLILPRNNNKQNFYGFSTKLSEYVVSGTPILMTNTGVVSQYFKDNFNCYMVEGYKREDFYLKLLTIFSNNEQEYRRIAHNAYHTGLDNFAYFKYTKALTSFLGLSDDNSLCH